MIFELQVLNVLFSIYDDETGLFNISCQIHLLNKSAVVYWPSLLITCSTVKAGVLVLTGNTLLSNSRKKVPLQPYLPLAFIQSPLFPLKEIIIHSFLFIFLLFITYLYIHLPIIQSTIFFPFALYKVCLPGKSEISLKI